MCVQFYDSFCYIFLCYKEQSLLEFSHSASLRDKELKTGLRELGHHEFKWCSKGPSCVVEEVCYPFCLLHMNQRDLKLYMTHLRGSEERL
jgi:hypothetical protein